MKVNAEQLRIEQEQLDQALLSMTQQMEALEEVRKNLLPVFQEEKIDQMLKSEITNLQEQRQKLKSMAAVLERVCGYYEENENHILNYIEDGKVSTWSEQESFSAGVTQQIDVDDYFAGTREDLWGE
ncbi:MAG: hypothetical protein EOM40_05320 [Clostridia bacterium]|nr:hypothetical protein [Clostridia bacterium]NCC44117.1 hypothetical protein [Clostridia bacterium]